MCNGRRRACSDRAVIAEDLCRPFWITASDPPAPKSGGPFPALASFPGGPTPQRKAESHSSRLPIGRAPDGSGVQRSYIGRSNRDRRAQLREAQTFHPRRMPLKRDTCKNFAPSHSDGIPITPGGLRKLGPPCDAHHRISARASVALPTPYPGDPVQALLGRSDGSSYSKGIRTLPLDTAKRPINRVVHRFHAGAGTVRVV